MMSNLPLDVQKALWRIYEKPEKSGFFYLHGARQLINPLNIAHDIRIIFAEGIKTSTTYTKRYAKHFDSALSQIIELLMFTQPDIGGTQCIEHLNYFVAPYYRIAKEEDKLNEFIIKNILQGFIEGLSREFVARTTDPIYSGLILDTSPKYVDRMSVVYAGNEHTNEKYENYNEEAKSITETIFKICSEESMYEQHRQFPRIFLRTTKEELKSNKELLDCLFNAACKMQSVYLINMDADINKRDRMPPTYFPDLSRVRRNEKREYTCPGHIQSATIYLPNFVGASNTELETPQQKEAIDIFLRILEWKKKKIKERINENDFFILGNNHAIMGNTPYFSSADPPATVRFYGIHRLTDKKGTETKNWMFIHNLQNFFSSLRKKHANFFTLAQTPMESGAITRFNYEGSLQNKSALFSPICFPLREKEKIIKEQITHEGLLQKEMEGGSALRIFITPSASYDAGGFLKNLLICMTKDIPLINIRRADRNISGGIVE